ncbi:MAG: hypothetical protein CPDRYMAC_5049 [uncultured Paraburkholderia sp.]|nr:MAG: hypothetical protein CPDRYDRY_4972 [uncultured Paraburkholderia sp.]CAH2939236.1 MAG: hypothetical protein CPDRYMAC_5049 [uncultured Paraburkholderia sp.]
MKDRSTIVCIRKGQILLIARGRSRWSLPGGTIKRSEAPLQAARRELAEETNLVDDGLTYLFRFGGLNKRHHVFLAEVTARSAPHPQNEITRCRWFNPMKIAALPASVPTRAIVELLIRSSGQKERRRGML